MKEHNKIKSTENNLRGNKRNTKVRDMDLSECGKYQQLNDSWVIWMIVLNI